MESRDARFLEEEIDTRNPTKLVELFEIPRGKEILNDNDIRTPNIEIISKPMETYHDTIGKIQRERNPTTRLKQYLTFISEENNDDPLTVKEALSSLDSNKWVEAIEEELDSIIKNNVCKLVDLPKDRKPIGNKWILKRKYKSDGTIDKYKARLVAKGFTQKPGIDYEETYSPVAKFTSIRILMSIVASLDLELFQMDVKTTILNGELKQEIYMVQPNGYKVEGQEHKVYKLKKSLYGLKQSSRQWYYTFHNAITTYGFKAKEYVHCVYYWNSGSNFIILS